MTDRPTPKILCLHGYRQNGKAFQTKSGGFRKCLKNRFSFVFIDAPHLIPQGDQNETGDETCLSWWFSGCDPFYFSSKHVSDYVYGFKESIDTVCQAWERLGPFSGILGFSQGASLLSLICALHHLGEFPYDFKFAIFVSGFQSLTSSHVAIYDRVVSGGGKIRIPSMHIIGENDQVVNASVCRSLATQLFESPSIVIHPGGHTVPSQTGLKSQYFQFFDSCDVNKAEERECKQGNGENL